MSNWANANIETSWKDGASALSKNQRMQFIPRVSFKHILEAAFDGLPQNQNCVSAKNVHGQPLAAFCTWQPYTDACVGAVLDMQKEASTKTEQRCDLRGFILDTDEQRDLKAELMGQVVEMWSNNMLTIPGQPRTTAQPFRDTSTEAKLEHKLTVVDLQGKLQLADTHLKEFLDNPTTVNLADEFLCAWQAQYQGPDAPTWLPNLQLHGKPLPQPAGNNCKAPLPGQYNCLQELLDDAFIAECASQDAAMKIMVNKQREMWIHILKDVTHNEGSKEISFGRRKCVDKTQTHAHVIGHWNAKNCTQVPAHVIDDTVVMFYKQDTGRVKLNL